MRTVLFLSCQNLNLGKKCRLNYPHFIGRYYDSDNSRIGNSSITELGKSTSSSVRNHGCRQSRFQLHPRCCGSFMKIHFHLM